MISVGKYLLPTVSFWHGRLLLTKRLMKLVSRILTSFPFMVPLPTLPRVFVLPP